MNDLRTAAQQALEAMEYSGMDVGKFNRINAACAALRAALAEPVQEPVAWMDREGDLYKMPEIEGWAPPHTMLYAAPPQRKPLPLKEVERLIYEHTKIKPNVADDRELLGYIVNAVRAIERAHEIGGDA